MKAGISINSIETDDLALKAEWNKKQAAVLVAVEDAYKWAIENGIAKECARVILPEGLTMSKLYVNGTLRSWLHYAKLQQLAFYSILLSKLNHQFQYCFGDSCCLAGGHPDKQTCPLLNISDLAPGM